MDHQQSIKYKCIKYILCFFVFNKIVFVFNIMESVTQRLRDPLLLGSDTIVAASNIFSHGINSQIHEKVFSLF